MAKNSDFESFLDVTYPPGSLEARYIDDAMRNIKEANANRLDQEHYWRKPDESGYGAESEGAHRPESARVWALSDSGTTGPAVAFPQKKEHLEGALMAVKGTATSSNLVGTVWYAAGGVLRQLLRYVRGKLRVTGQLWLGPNTNPLNGASVGSTGYTFEEPYPSGSSPAVERDNLTVWPYFVMNMAEVGSTQPNKRGIWPVRVGRFDPESGTFTPESAVTELGADSSYGLGVAVGNWPSDGTLFVFSRTGIEAYGNADSIYVNGVNVAKHNHSGEPGMGVKLNISDLVSQDPIGRIVVVKKKSFTASGIATPRDPAANPATVASVAVNEYYDLDDSAAPTSFHRVEVRVKSLTHSDGGASPRFLEFSLWHGGTRLTSETVAFFGATLAQNGFMLSVVADPGAIGSQPLELKVKRISDNESGTINTVQGEFVVTRYRA